ncbi:hypothetical protein ACLOJK_025627 [Asimina triloba]
MNAGKKYGRYRSAPSIVTPLTNIDHNHVGPWKDFKSDTVQKVHMLIMPEYRRTSKTAVLETIKSFSGGPFTQLARSSSSKPSIAGSRQDFRYAEGDPWEIFVSIHVECRSTGMMDGPECHKQESSVPLGIPKDPVAQG